MANPFGSADEALVKNTGHTNQANLVFAYIPRSTSKFVEVINGATVNPTAGNYDADGYWRSANTATNTSNYTLPTALSTGTARTLIAGLRYNGAGGGSGGLVLGLTLNSDESVRFYCKPDVYARQMQGQIQDFYSAAATGLRSANYDPGADTCAYAMKNSGTAQSALTRQPGVSSTAAGSDTVATLSTTDVSLDVLRVKLTNKWAFQYIFIYNAALSDANINSIIDDPGSVVSQGGATNQVVKVERGRALARGLGRGIF